MPLIEKLALSSSLASPLFASVKVKLLIDVSESTADKVPTELPMTEFSAIVFDVSPISMGGIFMLLTFITKALFSV